ncbi:DUF1289 domain-containing protein [Roseateles cellulosilyticus]|uniref:DUF1289 domain-containing protein n=1 Tax=Pelomonas cellulosilytica TaxID=2906762 RepID=A0ABS8Y0Z7_9BURK|nr:DUF1289 domain-containing protein [Pelomonas sp. P8]MCE4556618.1 DUF1289 domain-containing protein [Pelomonas sp. P8]
MTPPGMTAAVRSPCVNVCVMDAASGWCRGCARRLDEIAGWGTAPAGRHGHILAQLPARQAELQRRGLWLGPPSASPEAA